MVAAASTPPERPAPAPNPKPARRRRAVVDTFAFKLFGGLTALVMVVVGMVLVGVAQKVSAEEATRAVKALTTVQGILEAEIRPPVFATRQLIGGFERNSPFLALVQQGNPITGGLPGQPQPTDQLAATHKSLYSQADDLVVEDPNDLPFSIIVNADGVVLYDSMQPEAFGASMSATSVLSDVIKDPAGWGAYGFWVDGQGPLATEHPHREAPIYGAPAEAPSPGAIAPSAYLVVAIPLVLPDGSFVGAILTGQSAQRVVEPVESATGETVLFAVGSAIVSPMLGPEALSPAARKTLGEFAARTAVSDPPSELVLDGIPGASGAFRAGLAKLPGKAPGTVLLLQDRGPELAVLHTLRVFIALIGGIGVALAAAFALAFARLLSRPVDALVAGTRELAQGNLDHKVVTTSRDELGELAASFNEMAAGLKQRVFFEGALRRYLSEPVVEYLTAHPEQLSLAGQRREVSVLFFDVAGFTTLSEELPVEELVAVMSGYLDRLVQVIFEHHGTLDKFIGDAVMAFWGAPVDQPDHAARAVEAAVGMQVALRAFAKESKDERVRALSGRVGVNTGVAAIGNFGSSSQSDFTAMGDTVNLASRLEGVNKVYHSVAMASESTLDKAGRTGATWRSRELDLVRVKGRGKPVRIFELLPLAGEGALSDAALDAYAEGLAAYREGRWAKAIAAFEQAVAAGDAGPAAVLAERTREYATDPPPADWGGAYNLTTK